LGAQSIVFLSSVQEKFHAIIIIRPGTKRQLPVCENPALREIATPPRSFAVS